MTNTHDSQSLSNLELLVLARLWCSKGATEDEVVAAIAEVAPPDGPPSAREHAAKALATLRQLALAMTPKPTRRGARPRTKLTSTGERALCDRFGLDSKPRWDTMRERYLPALALGIATASQQARTLGQTDKLMLEVLRRHFQLTEASTTIALCNALIARALGFTGSVTLLRLQAHVLARGFGLEGSVESSEDLDALAARVASKSQDEVGDGKRPLRQALGRHWVYKAVSQPRAVMSASEAVLRTLHAVPAPPMVSSTTVQLTPGPHPFPAVPADMLLMLVHEAIPKIGSAGRFGGEKVFVSAIWRYLEEDGRLSDWSLDRFKRWLVTANRDRLIDLARADARGEMDSGMLEESEINDRGATFHFVVDRAAAIPGRGLHAR